MNTMPKTLLQIAGAEWAPTNSDKAALVLIDAQREYRDGRLPLANIDQATAEATRLLRAARRYRLPVIHIVQHSPSGRGVFDETGPMVDILPEVRPLEGEPVIAKHLPNAFSGTPLETALRDLGRSEILLAGYMTHMCVSATARAALDLGLRATVVADATATRDLPDPLGGIIPAAVVHRTALAELADRFARIVRDTGEAFAGLPEVPG